MSVLGGGGGAAGAAALAAVAAVAAGKPLSPGAAVPFVACIWRCCITVRPNERGRQLLVGVKWADQAG